MRKEALWLLSNLAANSEEDATEILNSDLITNLIFSAKDKNLDLRKEALWVISNICQIVNDKEYIRKIIYSNVIHLFFDILSYDTEYGLILILILSSLE